MKILLINHYAGSPNLGMEFRPYYVTKGWVKLGHEVLIVGGSYSHLRKVQPQSCEEMIDDVRYRWVKVNPYKGNGIGRIISMFSFVTKLYCNYRRYLRNFKPDIVIASSTYPLDIYPAYRIARHYHAKLIYEVHDLWPLSPDDLYPESADQRGRSDQAGQSVCRGGFCLPGQHQPQCSQDRYCSYPAAADLSPAAAE